MLEVYDKENVTCLELTVPHMGKVFAFLTDELAVDTGPSRCSSELEAFYKGASFDSVALTHSHEDHSGNAPWIQYQLGKPVFVHAKGMGTCSQFTPYPEYRQAVWGTREMFEPQPLGETISSRNHEWNILYTPGHAEDHVSFLNQNTGVLFSGDLFVTPKTKVVMREEAIPVIMESIKSVLAHDFGPMFCCHAGYVPDGRAMLQQKLDYLEQIAGEVKHLHAQGIEAEEITKRLFPKSYTLTAVSGGEWDSLHIITSIIADEATRRKNTV